RHPVRGLRHTIDSVVPRVIASMHMREQILQVNPTIAIPPCGKGSPFSSNSDEERSRHAKKISCLLGRELLVVPERSKSLFRPCKFFKIERRRSLRETITCSG